MGRCNAERCSRWFQCYVYSVYTMYFEFCLEFSIFLIIDVVHFASFINFSHIVHTICHLISIRLWYASTPSTTCSFLLQ